MLRFMAIVDLIGNSSEWRSFVASSFSLIARLALWLVAIVVEQLKKKEEEEEEEGVDCKSEPSLRLSYLASDNGLVSDAFRIIY